MASAQTFPACPYPAWEPPAKVRLTVLPERPCSYLPGRMAQIRAFWARRIAGEIYHDLMDAGFRRSGALVYQPICNGCRACLPIRVLVDEFRPSKSQRRSVRRNADLAVSIGPPEATDEKWDLYQRYLGDWHQGKADGREEFESFLYVSPVETVEFTYREPDGRLVGVGICDLTPKSLSSVYFYFDPAASDRGLGTFSALLELDFARHHQIPYYYLGYWIDQCRAMSYKANYRPHQVLYPDNIWRAGDDGKQGVGAAGRL